MAKQQHLRQFSNITAMKSKGQIKSYQVIDEACSDKICDVLLSVIIPVYKSPGLSPDNRRKLVIIPFKGKMAKAFTDNLQTSIVQSRRFTVVDREHDIEYAKEKQVLLSSDTALGEKIRLGQVLGFDYMVLGEVSYQDHSREESVLLTGESKFVQKINTRISYKIINLATRQVKWQDTSSFNALPNSEVGAQKVAREITDAIYPVKVIASTANHIILNQGGKNYFSGYDLRPV